MAKKQKGFLIGADEAPVAPRKRIGILMKNFMQCKSYGPQVAVRNIKPWQAGQIIWSEETLDELLIDGALIEVYYQDVDRPAED